MQNWQQTLQALQLQQVLQQQQQGLLPSACNLMKTLFRMCLTRLALQAMYCQICCPNWATRLAQPPTHSPAFPCFLAVSL